jgi:hypothetical protein
MNAPNRLFGRPVLIGVASLLLVAAIIFIASCGSGSGEAEHAREEAKVISNLVFEIYLEDPEEVIGMRRGIEDNHRLFNTLIAMDKLEEIEYIIDSRRMAEWHKKGLAIDPWGNPFAIEVIEVAKDDKCLKVCIVSNGPDGCAGTSDDVRFDASY